MNQNWKNIVFNICLTLNCLLIFLLLFGAGMKVPVLLQVAGRMHPLILHFPIVLLILAFVWELFVPKKDHPTLTEAGDWLLLSAAFTAVLAALMGLFLSREAGYDPDTIAWHKWTGVMIALISVMWFAFRNNVRKKRFFVLAAGGISLIGIILAGHQGANITHGENFLLAPVIPAKKKRDVLFEDAIAYTHLIVPILEEKCMGCHNSRKAKGELIMETEELLIKGGKDGKLWDSTASGFGLMMQRLHLPLQDKKHMPPKGKSQLTDNEIAALFYWIKNGASFTQKIADLPATDTLRIIAADFFNTLEGDNYDFAAADDATINKLNNEYRVLHPLAQNSPALVVTFFGASFFKSEQLKELEKVKNQVVSLNLNRMPVKDEDLKYIAVFKNLRKLNLSFTEITGSGLKELTTLKDLRQLSLSGNKLKSADLEMLAGLEKLSSVYLWETGINDPEIASLKKKFPDTHLETGFRGDTIIARLNEPIIVGEEQVFKDTLHVKLKHYINGVEMRYTLDGSEPDSVLSPLYKDFVSINKAGVLKVKAFLPGWISSDVIAKNFYKTGFVADSIRLVTNPAPAYTGEGGKTIVDAEKGNLDFKSGKWLGFMDEELKAFLYFNKPVRLSTISFSSLVDIGSYIMPPQQLEVWGGTTFSDLVLLKKIYPKQPVKLEPAYLTGFDCTFTPKELSILKIVAKPVSPLPAWHPGKGQKAWFFVDEIFIN